MFRRFLEKQTEKPPEPQTFANFYIDYTYVHIESDRHLELLPLHMICIHQYPKFDQHYKLQERKSIGQIRCYLLVSYITIPFWTFEFNKVQDMLKTQDTAKFQELLRNSQKLQRYLEIPTAEVLGQRKDSKGFHRILTAQVLC